MIFSPDSPAWQGDFCTPYGADPNQFAGVMILVSMGTSLAVRPA